MKSDKQSIAVIGGGIAGLSAAYFLRDRYDVRLFEKTARLGGNAYAHQLPSGERVDVGACLFSTYTDPNLLRLMREVGVRPERPTAHSMSIYDLDSKRCLSVDFGLRALVAQRFDILRPRTLRSLVALHFASRKGVRLLRQGKLRGLSMREVTQGSLRLSGDTLLLFMFALCCLSSMSYDEIQDAPAEFFFAKLAVMGYLFVPEIMITLRCAAGGTKSYVDALASHYPDRIRLNAPIQAVDRDADGVTLKLGAGEELRFDKVVFACNADQTLALLAQPTPEEERLLGAWTYKNGKVVVHKDASAFPERHLCQGFTFLYTQRDGQVNTSVNGCCWYQPGVSPDCEYVGAQHPNYPIAEEAIDHTALLRTPIYDRAAVATIPELSSLNGVSHSYHCGSHIGYGLHEDAVRSAIVVAKELGVLWPARGTLLQRIGLALSELLGLVGERDLQVLNSRW